MRRLQMMAGAATVLALAPVGAMAQDAASVEELVVTGTRGAGRAALDAPAPVDVVTSAQIADTGYPDLGRALNFLEPSVNFARAATTASAANTRPITLRGLAPDQTLVLVNGKRRHANAVLNVNNSIGRGSAAVDLDTIPESAIERIEILKDGAAAQYGSDAIAGVVNIILKDDAEGETAALLTGVTEQGDGANGLATATVGLPLGDGGHLTVTGLFRAQEPTNRALVDQRFGRVTYRIGDPEAWVGSVAINAAASLGDAEAYGFGILTRKVSNNGAGFRVPGFSPVHPNGFLPIIEPQIWDIGLTAGVRGEFAGISADVSQTFGYNQAEFRVYDTANVSLGLASPTRFDAGAVSYQQFVTDAVLSRPLDGLLAGGNLAAGVQFRHETYSIANGEPLAYFGLGADGFAGFNPRNPTDASRNAYALFLDAELRPIEPLLLAAAVRYDHYDDFGGKATWRVTGRYEIMPGIAMRGSAGIGFKAPSLQQQYFSAVQGALSAGVLVTVGTLPVDDPVARALGAVSLAPETSRNVGGGLVVGPFGGFTFTGDYYRIRIEDRIALSEQLGGPAVRAILTAAGITNFQQVRFFTNALDTTTEGFELTATWRGEVGAGVSVDLAAGYGVFETSLDELGANPVLPTLPLLSNKSILFVTQAQPRNKFTLQASASRGPWEVRAALAVFGQYRSAPLVAAQDFDGKETFDLGFGYDLNERIRLDLGVQNLFDAKPDTIDDQASVIASTGGSFPTGEETPIGVNGRSYFVRLQASF
ncbi:TonB-dependent receptor plug domain-containing protein [Phenylobacterium ferrooxidans]|uniref:TonB-dependent receptor n=1 Tax=Phenylobacterium ferrooxidans TaxID=2982689 RepID=A0ABW6CW90_9CAUL